MTWVVIGCGSSFFCSPGNCVFDSIAGCSLGWAVGWLVGFSVGWAVGWLVGCAVGWLVGCSVGCAVGWLVGWLSFCASCSAIFCSATSLPCATVKSDWACLSSSIAVITWASAFSLLFFKELKIDCWVMTSLFACKASSFALSKAFCAFSKLALLFSKLLKVWFNAVNLFWAFFKSLFLVLRLFWAVSTFDWAALTSSFVSSKAFCTWLKASTALDWAALASSKAFAFVPTLAWTSAKVWFAWSSCFCSNSRFSWPLARAACVSEIALLILVEPLFNSARLACRLWTLFWADLTAFCALVKFWFAVTTLALRVLILSSCLTFCKYECTKSW